MKRKAMVSLVSRTGRHNQRYNDNNGRRLVVGCIPYRFKKTCTVGVDQGLEVLIISSQKGHGILFPKGGWENDELMEEAASREAMEEAGVLGKLEVGVLLRDYVNEGIDKLGTWNFKSKTNDNIHEGTMFPLLVTKQLDAWPEKHVRHRQWVAISEAREGCKYLWMKEALDAFVNRLSRSSRQLEEDKAPFSLTQETLII